MKKYHLLDHKWQKIGFAIFVFGIALFLIFLLNSVFTFQPTQIEGLVENYKLRLFNKIMQGPLPILSFISAIAFALMSLSQEKQEDERIVETRHQILPRIVILFIIVLIIRFIAGSILIRLAEPLSYAIITRIIGLFTDVTAFMGYYVLFFKLSLWKQNRELSDEE
jgi:energy-coupling factor transporter transmembrane protein EcfT